TKALSVTYSDIAIYVNDEAISPKDADGNAVEPFIADGTTYLPVRAVAEALGFAVSWDGATKSIYVGEQPEVAAAADNEANSAVYAKYRAAADAIEAADSYEASISGDTIITADGKKTEMTLAGSIKLIKHSDTDVEFISETTATVAGTEVAANVYYKDGILYTEAGGEKIKMALPLEAALAKAQTSGVEIEEEAIKTQSMDGDTITFTLDGGKLSELANAALSGLKEFLPTSGSYAFGDAVCTTTLDAEGALKDIRIAFSLDLTIEDAITTLSYDLTTSYTRVGGVSITAPTDLSSYKDLDTGAK
ncbi:MAG: copper amine oxidase N-terminal domain-containing protein, partial [Clostridiales Family XIII bacterium]|nr:copper amine oxidase N-terminal domain-containing protein [Clostridiales Family XIII bacterium]